MILGSMLALLLVVALIGLSAVLATAETGITAASKPRLFQLARDGNKRAERVAPLLDERERLVSSILLGSTLVNAAATALTTSVLQAIVGDAAVLYATGLITVLLLVFAEALPKILGIARADKVVMALGPTANLLSQILAPIIRLVLATVRGTLKLCGVNVDERDASVSSSDEIRGTIDLHAQEGGLGGEHRQMLGSILDLDEVLVSDVMVHRKAIEMIDLDEPPEAIVRMAIRSSYTRLPLYRGNPDNPVGVLHAKDLIRALAKRGAEPETLRIDTIMRKPWFVPNTTTLREQLGAFIAQRNHFALVVDEYGALQGLVTLEDILEEIVGEIADEHDLPTPSGVEILPDGSLRVEGTVAIRELNRRFDWSLSDHQAATVAGLVIYEAQVIPVKGQSFQFFGFTFEILERRRNQITLLRIVPPAPVTGQTVDAADA